MIQYICICVYSPPPDTSADVSSSIVFSGAALSHRPIAGGYVILYRTLVCICYAIKICIH